MYYDICFSLYVHAESEIRSFADCMMNDRKSSEIVQNYGNLYASVMFKVILISETRICVNDEGWSTILFDKLNRMVRSVFDSCIHAFGNPLRSSQILRNDPAGHLYLPFNGHQLSKDSSVILFPGIKQIRAQYPSQRPMSLPFSDIADTLRC